MILTTYYYISQLHSLVICKDITCTIFEFFHLYNSVCNSVSFIIYVSSTSFVLFHIFNIQFMTSISLFKIFGSLFVPNVFLCSTPLQINSVSYSVFCIRIHRNFAFNRQYYADYKTIFSYHPGTVLTDWI